MVLVPDRDAELKARVERDEADKRIASAALKLARIYTNALDGSVAADLYVNLDNAAVAALLQARVTSPSGAGAAAALLRATVTLMGGWREGGAPSDVSGALAQVTEAARRLAEGDAR
jgi:molecular chaperone HtpG